MEKHAPHSSSHSPAHAAKEGPKDSRDKLLQAAKRVFALRGFDGATLKELADEAGVNVSLVSYYFGGKEGLLKACVEEAGRDRLATAERILKAPQSLEDFKVRLTVFVEEFINYHLTEKEICTILNRECMLGMKSTWDVFKDTFLKAHHKLEEFFRSAQKAGLVRKDVDIQVMTYLFFGSLASAVRFEAISKEIAGKSLEEKNFRDVVVRHAIEHLLGGFLTPEPDRAHP